MNTKTILVTALLAGLPLLYLSCADQPNKSGTQTKQQALSAKTLEPLLIDRDKGRCTTNSRPQQTSAVGPHIPPKPTRKRYKASDKIALKATMQANYRWSQKSKELDLATAQRLRDTQRQYLAEQKKLSALYKDDPAALKQAQYNLKRSMLKNHRIQP